MIHFDILGLDEEKKELEQKISKQDFWENQEKTRIILTKTTILEIIKITTLETTIMKETKTAETINLEIEMVKEIIETIKAAYHAQ